MHHIEPLSEGLVLPTLTLTLTLTLNPHPHPNRHLKLTQLEAMLKDMPAEARAKLVASAKGKVAARATARQAGKAGT